MKTSKPFFISLILFMMCWVVFLFKPFLMPMTIGMLLAVSTANMHMFFLRLSKNRQTLSAVITTLIFCTLFLAPLLYAIIEIIRNASNLDASNFQKIADYIKGLGKNHLPAPFSVFEPKVKELIANFDIGAIIKKIVEYLSVFGKNSAGFLMDTLLIVVFYFFTNLYSTDLLHFFKKVTPIDNSRMDYIFNEVGNTMSVVFYSTIFNAILQGFLFSIIAGAFGYNAFLMCILFSFSCLIPLCGGALVYVPVALFELANGNTSAAIIVFLYSVIVISVIADSFIKPLIIKFINSRLVDNPANINELLIFFSMLAGISAFGFWGMFLGPAILTLFLTILRLYEYLTSRNLL